MAEHYESDVQPPTIYAKTVYLDEEPVLVEYLIDEKVHEEKVRVCKDKKWDRVPMEQLNMNIKIGTNAPVLMEDTKQLGHYVPADKAGYTFQFVKSSSTN